MARRHHGQRLEPDPYEILPQNKRTVFHVMDVAGYENERNRDISPYNIDDWDSSRNDHDGEPNGMWAYNHPNEAGQYVRPGAYGIHKVVDCDELSFFAQPLRYNLGWGVTSGHIGALDIRQTDLDGERMFQSRVTNLKDFNDTYGNYYPWGNDGTRGALVPIGDPRVDNSAGFQIYTDSTKTTNITDGWNTPYTPMILQLIGQLPRHHEINGTGDRYDDIKDFFFADEDTDKIGVVNANWGHHKNISGLGLLPGGKLPNFTYDIRPAQVDSFGTTSVWTTWKSSGAIALTSFAVPDSPMHQTGVRISSSVTSGHGGNVRYCRPKTVTELGYRLIVDRLADKVKFRPVDWDIDAANTEAGPIIFPTPDPEERIHIVQENGTYNWNHANTLIFNDQSVLRGTKIIQIKIEFQTAGVWHLMVTSNTQNDPLYIKRIYPFNVTTGWNTIDCDVDLASNEYLALGSIGYTVDGVLYTDTARHRVAYPVSGIPIGGSVFTANNGQTNTNMNPNVAITVQPPTPEPIDRFIELPIGMERGIALRYSNRQHRVVLRSWSKIQEEANTLYGNAILNIDN